MDKNANSLLAPFLRKLADDLDQKKLSPEELQLVGDFYMSWVLNSDSDESEISDKEFMKFVTMGWYVYRQILKGQTV